MKSGFKQLAAYKIALVSWSLHDVCSVKEILFYHAGEIPKDGLVGLWGRRMYPSPSTKVLKRAYSLNGHFRPLVRMI